MNEQFNIFMKKFNLNDKSIKKKYDHSLRVQKKCEEIAIFKKYNKEKYTLASLIGLLHDYGRFYQWDKYKTFTDKDSIDHGDYAVKKLFEENEIIDFYKNKNNYNIIYESIKYHNKYEVPKEVQSKEMCNLIRDADKLDILYMYTIGELELKEKGEVSDKVKKIFFSHKLLNSKYIDSEIDVTIRTLCLIYDLNFNYSYKYLKEKQIIEKIFEKTKNKEILKPYFEEIIKYIERKTGEENVRKEI